MYNKFAKNIIKESDLIRQTYYTMTKIQLVDVIDISAIILRLFSTIKV